MQVITEEHLQTTPDRMGFKQPRMTKVMITQDTW